MQRINSDEFDGFSKQFKHEWTARRIYIQCQLITRNIMPAVTDIWTDSLQNPNLVALLPTELDPEGRNGAHSFYTKPGLNYATFERLMDTLPIPHEQFFIMEQIEYSRTLPLLQKYFADKGGKFHCTSSHPYTTYYMPYVPTNTVEDFKEVLPPGYYVDSLSVNEAKIVNDTWFYKRDVDTICKIEFWLKYLPSSCIRTEEGEIVANALCTDWATAGLVYVDPKHRRLGLGAVLLRDYVQKVFALGLEVPAYSQITTSNAASLKLAQRVGWNHADWDIMFGYHYPKGFSFRPLAGDAL